MGQGKINPPKAPPDWKRALLFAWLAGALAPQVPFQRLYKFGNGGLGYNILIAVALVALGVILVAGITRLTSRLVQGSHRKPALRRWTTWCLGTSAVCSLLALLPIPFLDHSWKWIFGGALLFLAAWLILSLQFIIASAAVAPRLSTKLTSASDPHRAKQTWSYNGAFWLLVFVIVLTLDLMHLAAIAHRSGWDTVVLILGRIVTLGALTVGLLLLVHTLLALTPVGLRWLVIAGAALLPLLVITNYAAGIYWQQSLLAIVNSFTFTGDFDMKRMLEAGGLESSPLEVYLLLGALTIASIAAYLGLRKLSARIPCRISTTRALLVFGSLWLGAIAQQALCNVTLNREIWQAEHTTFTMHLGLLAPDPGLETIPVQFREAQSGPQVEAILGGSLPTLARKPDIFIVMVETWRADSVTPKIAPFLTRFRDEECQQLGTTFAGSNCTPVSWFTFFHSRLGIHWKLVVESEKASGGLRGAYPIRLLHKLGYRFSVRAVCDLAYQEMSDCNFGAGHKLADQFLDNPMMPRGINIPEREVIIVDDFKKQLLASPPGGHLHFLSFDSPHYNYYWPQKEFEPLHRDCIGNVTYPAKPTAEYVREIVKRYENSINWIDHQAEELVAFLKAENRYDNSIIILTGDHGEDFQEDGSWFHCSNLKRSQTEVPIMIKWPSWLTNQPAHTQASHLDVMPSLLDALGLEKKFTELLAGRSLLRNHSGEAVLSTQWAGNSKIGVCFIKDGVKANFRASRLWSGKLPETLYLMGYTDLDDKALDPLAIRGDLTHLEALRQRYPESTTRFFTKFGAEQQ